MIRVDWTGAEMDVPSDPLVAAYEAGAQISELAAARGLTNSGIYYRLARAGCKMRRKGPAPSAHRSQRAADILAARNSGRSLKDVGREFGITCERVRPICEKMGDTVTGRERRRELAKAATEASRHRRCEYCGRLFYSEEPRRGCTMYHTHLAAGRAVPEQTHRDAIAAKAAGATWQEISKTIYGHADCNAQIYVQRWAKRTGYDLSWLIRARPRRRTA